LVTAIFPPKKCTSLPFLYLEIGELSGPTGAAVVAKGYQRFTKGLVSDAELKSELRKLEGNFSYVMG
jgi:hypothetical protein